MICIIVYHLLLPAIIGLILGLCIRSSLPCLLRATGTQCWHRQASTKTIIHPFITAMCDVTLAVSAPLLVATLISFIHRRYRGNRASHTSPPVAPPPTNHIVGGLLTPPPSPPQQPLFDDTDSFLRHNTFQNLETVVEAGALSQSLRRDLWWGEMDSVIMEEVYGDSLGESFSSRDNGTDTHQGEEQWEWEEV